MKSYREALDLLEKTFELVQDMNHEDVVTGVQEQFKRCMVFPNQMLYVVTYNPSSIVYARNVEKILGRGSSFNSVNDIFTSIHEDDIDYVARVVKDGFGIAKNYTGDSTRLILTIEYRMKRTDGSIIIVQRNTKSLEIDSNNMPSTTVSVVTDITRLYTGSFHPRAVLCNRLADDYFYFKSQTIQENFSLSKREIEILRLLCTGLSSKEIAQQLYISKHTVDGHRRMLLEKTGKSSTTELVSFTLTNQLIED